MNRVGRFANWATWASFAIVVLAAPALAELQQVSVGGELRIRGRWYMNTWSETGRHVVIPSAWLPRRPLGFNGVSSLFRWDDDNAGWTRYEMSTLLNIKADFTDEVSVFAEFYDWNVWGEDFRSRAFTSGQDARATTNDDVEVNQAYIDVRDLLGEPLSLRIGRQNLKMGKGWLVSDMLTPSQYLSFDALRLTYAPGDFTFDVFAAKLAERCGQPQDTDADFYGVHGAYAGFDPVQLSAYWFFLREGLEASDTNGALAQEWLEDAFGLGDYEATKLHTVGVRAFGAKSNFDYDLELAYQFGSADAVGARFVPAGLTYGDEDARYNAWGSELTVAYTFKDTPWQPRPYVMGVYFEGEDHRDISFLDWLNPFYRPRASVSFNRLFSDKNYMPTVNDNGWISNVKQLAAGVQVSLSPKVKVNLQVAKDWAVAPYDFPWSVRLNHRFVPLFPDLPFLTSEGSDELCWDIAAWIRYEYSKDLWFLLYGNYLVTDDGLTGGSFIQFNGTDFSGGSDDKNAAYLFWMAVLRF